MMVQKEQRCIKCSYPEKPLSFTERRAVVSSGEAAVTSCKLEFENFRDLVKSPARRLRESAVSSEKPARIASLRG